ncbi:MAG: hypothetical protein JO159_16055 [Acidobacteria bacterium]|nr:hypothetical protein [Acidobacteriota bacterium]MBV9625788.1 hypothetical protein [Acidobacteriota bacterium]
MPSPLVTNLPLSDQPTLGEKSPLARSAGDEFLRNNADKIAVLLCIYAAFRIWFFAAAFPLFNNIDEQSHFACVEMFVEGRFPGKKLPPFDPVSARIASIYSSGEYLNPEDLLVRTGQNVPITSLPPGRRETRFHSEFAYWSRHVNFEAQAPPLYYLLAAGWYRLAASAGITDWGLAYWIRFLNIVLYTLLVWISYRFARAAFPANSFLFLSIPALVAVFPQDVFFGINRDVLSAPLTAVALLFLMKAADGRGSRHWAIFLGAFAVGLTFLVNLSNWVALAALAVALWFWLRSSSESRARKTALASAAVLTAIALPSAWIFYNYLVLGDPTGSRAKIAYLGWTLKPVSGLLHHPFFSFSGLSYFLLSLTRTFWRGEYVWHGQAMRTSPADWFYVLSSGLFVLIFVVSFLRRQKSLPRQQLLVGWQALVLIAGSVLFMAAISLLFDFDGCVYPSRERPYFVSGRIISGALLPFVMIYAGGLEALAARIRPRIHPLFLLGSVMLFITVSEIWVRSRVLSSPFNFFNLLSP